MDAPFSTIHYLSSHENIILVGFMGTGKSAVGRRVASRLRFRFVDTDQLIIEREGMPIAEIFARQGEKHFRELETAALKSLGNLRRRVMATGGGIVLKEDNRALLKSLGFVIWLTASEDAIFERVSRNDKRPLLQTENPRATISQLLAARRPFYEGAADFSIDTTRVSHDEAAEAVVVAARNAFGWDSEK